MFALLLTTLLQVLCRAPIPFRDVSRPKWVVYRAEFFAEEVHWVAKFLQRQLWCCEVQQQESAAWLVAFLVPTAYLRPRRVIFHQPKDPRCLPAMDRVVVE